MRQPSKVISVRYDEDTLRDVEHLAKANKQTSSYMIRRLVKTALAEEMKQRKPQNTKKGGAR
jgi:predicted transcriptional regulator